MKLILVLACSSKNIRAKLALESTQSPQVLNEGVDAQHNFVYHVTVMAVESDHTVISWGVKNTQDFFVAALFYWSTYEKELKFLSFLKLAKHFFRKNTELANSRWRDILYVRASTEQTNTCKLLTSLKMNAIIALCHFCEYHGPSVLFCTQVNIEELNLAKRNYWAM